MADELQAVADAAVETPANEQAATPDAPGKQADSRTFTQAEVDALIRDRLARADKQAQSATEKARADAERKALEEQGKFKELAERYQAEAQQSAARAQALEMAQLRRNIGDKLGLSPALAERLQGATAEELEADGKALLALIPKPAAPNINAAPGVGAAPVTGQMTPEYKAELAAKYGVNPKYLT